jgi:hypothetical protein
MRDGSNATPLYASTGSRASFAAAMNALRAADGLRRPSKT